MRKLALATALAILGSLGFSPGAFAAPVWNLDVHHGPTNFPPGGEGRYWLDVSNVGDEDTSAESKVTVALPGGVSFASQNQAAVSLWSCDASPGDSVFECTTTETIARHNVDRTLRLDVDVASSASGVRTASAKLEGGGASEFVTTQEPARISPDPAPFGILPDTFVPDFFEADGKTPVRVSGAHPDLFTVPFDLASDRGGAGNSIAPSDNLRNIAVDLPPGFLGDPTAIGECTQAEFTVGSCTGAAQVGRVDANLDGILTKLSVGVFNLTHPQGRITDFGLVVGGNPVHIYTSLNPSNRYGIRSVVPNINETFPPFDQKVTLWGVPADASHNSERCEGFRSTGATDNGVRDTSEECSTDFRPKPFLTAPFSCSDEHQMTAHRYDSWQDTGDFGPPITYTQPGKTVDCDVPRFDPEIALNPTGDEAGTPTGLDVTVHVPQNDSPNALATPPVKSTTVTLPEGMAVNPAFSDGLVGCSEAEIGLGTNDPVRCPDNSRIGELELSTPLLPGRVEGSMYLAEQEANPYGSLIAFYMAMHDTEERGILVKVPAKVELDPGSGQITTSFDDLPQFPFEDLTLEFRSGERAPLVNPPVCGTHRIAGTMTSYAQPDAKVDVTNAYGLGKGPGGAPCVSALSSRAFEPQLASGTINPVAGAFSPMALRVTRSDADQELSTVKGTAPEGLLASLRGVERCSDAQIARAEGRSAPGQGAEEQADPSCPAASQVGTVSTGAGAGPSPIYVGGKIYLAGPYKGAPISGVAIVPAVAGPIDVGTVVVRAPARIDPVTAQLELETDELPQVVNGVLVRVRDVRVRLDRPDFTINPTDCREKGIEGTLFSTEGKAKSLFNRFQVGDCGSLEFKPRIALRVLGGVRRGAHPAFKAVVRPRLGDANFSRAVVTLPNSAFLDQAHIRTICTRVQFAAGAGNGANCPPGAVYGSARAWSPLVDGAFEGPVFLRSSNNKLPDLVVALKGPDALPIDFELSSRIDSVRGGIRSSFETIPDVPVSRFVLNMQGGKKGLIVNSRNLCVKPKRNRARANLRGQNGRLSRTKPRVVATTCVKRRKAKRRKAKRARTSHTRAARR